MKKVTNPDKHEIPFRLGEKQYLLTFNNEGKRVAEDVIGMGWPKIGETIDREGMGFKLQTGLFFGASRKYHRRDFPNIATVDALLDKLEEADDETQTEFVATLIALYLRDKKEEWVKRLNGELIEEPVFDDEAEEGEPEAEPEDVDASPKDEESAPAKKSSASRSAGGKSSKN
jgi:hypothetical protein